MEVWRALEALHRAGRVRFLGLSNTYDMDTLARLYNASAVKPAFLQNRFYSASGYDVDIRQFCRERNIAYQSFWTLTANPSVLQSHTVRALANKYAKTPSTDIFQLPDGDGNSSFDR
jgi:diketogulonate reductase-like aldo/keto reductase